MDSVTVEDWGEEIFAEGVGVKRKKCAAPTPPLPVKHPVTIQDGSIEPIYLAFRSEITPALQAMYGPVSFSLSPNVCLLHKVGCASAMSQQIFSAILFFATVHRA